MSRRRSPAAADPLANLAEKLEILEREMAAQRAALERLKQMGAAPRPTSREPVTPPAVRKSA
jgi:hypothetical protein